jgi:hypothetical protein
LGAERPEVRVEEFAQVVFAAEEVGIRVAVGICREVFYALAGDEEMAEDGVVGRSWLDGKTGWSA